MAVKFDLPFAGNCDFEKGQCSWINTQKGDTFDWIRGSGGTPSIYTGPATDHTTGLATGKQKLISNNLNFRKARKIRNVMKHYKY